MEIKKLNRRSYIKERADKRQRGRSKGTSTKDIGHVILFLAVFLGIWQVIFSLGVFPKVSLPSPAMVAQSFADLLFNGSLVMSIGMTLWRLVTGFSISIILGIGIGLLMVRFRDFGKTMSSFAVGLQSFPSIAWVPFAILLVGLNDFGILFVVVMSSIFSVMLSTYSGIRNIHVIYLRAARNMGAGGISLFAHVMIPAATPSLIIGIRQAWSFAWHALIGAEMLITTLYGLGHVLAIGREFNDMSQIIAVMITIFVIGLLFDRIIFLRLEEKIRSRWGLN